MTEFVAAVALIGSGLTAGVLVSTVLGIIPLMETPNGRPVRRSGAGPVMVISIPRQVPINSWVEALAPAAFH